MQGRRPQRGPGGAGASVRPGGPDVNRDRLVFCVTSLVGQRATVQLRSNVAYQGVFHSCSVDGDFSITLKSARKLLADDQEKSGEIIPTLIIPGKDFLQVSAENMAPPWGLADESPPTGAHGARGFTTDGEIAVRKPNLGGERELVPWGDGGSGPVTSVGLEDGGHDPHWDQFDANSKLYGVSSTFNEELYTTKLNREAIPKEQRDRAERIAREIESGQMNSDVEGRMEADEDEEAHFSAVQSSSASRKDVKGEARARNAAPLALLPPARDLPQHDALASLPNEGFGRDLKNNNKRGGLVSEMKRINALNLEPTLPKPDYATKAALTAKDPQARNSRMQGTDLKQEFQQSLEMIQKQEASKARKLAAGGASPQSASTAPSSGPGPADWGQGHRKDAMGPAPNQGPCVYPAGGGRPKFAFNPAAGEFTPSGSAVGTVSQGPGNPVGAVAPVSNVGAVPPVPSAKPSGTTPAFPIQKKNQELLRKSLGEILEPFFNKSKGSTPESGTPDWPDAKGPSYHEVLGQPNPQSRTMAPQLSGGVGVPGPAAAGWQPPSVHDQGPPTGPMGPAGGGPGMMPQGFVMANAPPGAPPAQMYQQVFTAPAGAPPGGPQGPQGGPGMPPQGPPTMVFTQQAMISQPNGQQMGVPVGMVPAPGGNPGAAMGMGPMPKFGGQQQMVVFPMMLAGGYQQGYLPPQGVQGQGPPGPMGHQGDGSQQGQMMQQPLYGRQGGPG